MVAGAGIISSQISGSGRRGTGRQCVDQHGCSQHQNDRKGQDRDRHPAQRAPELLHLLSGRKGAAERVYSIRMGHGFFRNVDGGSRFDRAFLHDLQAVVAENLFVPAFSSAAQTIHDLPPKRINFYSFIVQHFFLFVKRKNKRKYRTTVRGRSFYRQQVLCDLCFCAIIRLFKELRREYNDNVK